MNKSLVFCQITSADTSPDMCVELQHSHDPSDCFGCGAHSRLCARCRIHPLVCPELDLCRHCLDHAVVSEQTTAAETITQAAGHNETYCQIVNRGISAPMCLATQEPDGCNQCPSPYRLCDQCGARTVYYPQYGLCLHCAVEKYEPLPGTEGEEPMTVRSEPVLPDRIVNLPGLEPEQGLKTEKLPIKKKRGTRRRRKIASDRKLYPEVKKFVLGCQTVSYLKIMKHFGLAFHRAKHLIEQLEKDGVVGPRTGRYQQRLVLVTSPAQQIPSTSADQPATDELNTIPHSSRRDRIRRLGVLCAVLGQGEITQLLQDTIADLELLERQQSQNLS